MRFIKLYLTVFTISLFLIGCNSSGTEETISSESNLNEIPENQVVSDESTYWAKENLDLQVVGNLLEKAETAEEFEYLLNNEDGVNNLDLNGDGYVDYISVAEYDDGYEDQRGFTLFNRFGTDEIQEIASIIFNRDRLDAPGARVLLTGNEQLYGDDNYYETNWLDKSLAIANWIFSDRNDRYESPYYYENYPENYEIYEVVETPVYRTRIREYYPEPIFIQTVNPTIQNIKIKSSYRNKTFNKIYANLAKPSRNQIEFRKNNPRRPEFVQLKKEQIKRERRENVSYKRVEREKIQKDFEKSKKQQGEDYRSRNLPNRGQIIDFEKNKPVKVDRENNRPSKVERKQERSPKQNAAGKQNGNNDKGKNRGNDKGKGKKP